MKVFIHTKAEMCDDIWGVNEFVDDLESQGATEQEIVKEVLALAQEDWQALLENADYRVEIEREGKP